MILGGTNGGSLVVRAPTRDEVDFTLGAVTRDNVITGAVSSEITVKDSVFARHVTSTIDREADVVIETATAGAFNAGITYRSERTDLLSVDGAGRVTRVGDGDARVIVSTPDAMRAVRVAVARTSSVQTDVFNRFVPGSLGRHCVDAVDSRIVGKTLAIHGPLFSTRNDSTATYVWNAARWCADIDLTCVSVWNSTGANTRGGTLVSPRHVVFATHYLIAVGATLRFVKADGTVVTRTMTARSSVPGTYSDLTVGVLDSDVPAGIAFAKVLPVDYDTAKMPGVRNRVPALKLDQEKKASVADYYGTNGFWSICLLPTDPQRLAMYEEVVVGDSGSPSFLIVNGGPVLTHVMLFGGPGAGGLFTDNRAGVNAAMTALGGGYQLTDADLSGFTSY